MSVTSTNEAEPLPRDELDCRVFTVRFEASPSESCVTGPVTVVESEPLLEPCDVLRTHSPVVGVPVDVLVVELPLPRTLPDCVAVPIEVLVSPRMVVSVESLDSAVVLPLEVETVRVFVPFASVLDRW